MEHARSAVFLLRLKSLRRIVAVFVARGPASYFRSPVNVVRETEPTTPIPRTLFYQSAKAAIYQLAVLSM
jgi:hypothetical protein